MKYKGRFGVYGGFYVPEVLIPVLEELEEAFYRFYEDTQFTEELAQLSRDSRHAHIPPGLPVEGLHAL